MMDSYLDDLTGRSDFSEDRSDPASDDGGRDLGGKEKPPVRQDVTDQTSQDNV